MADFKPFSQAIHKRFVELSKHELFVVDIEPDALFAAYLAAFPEGSNPIYRERTEHDCSCCRNFVKNIGNVVAIIDNRVHTVWDVRGLASPYAEVAQAMNAFVKSRAIVNLFRTKEPSYGAEQTREMQEGGTVKTWNHFHSGAITKHFTKNADAVTGTYRTTVGVFKRGLETLSAEAIADVVGLISAKSLYRGEEHLAALREFAAVKAKYDKMNDSQKEIFVWSNADSPAARFKNTVIGTLVADLSEDSADMEKCVKSFESKVAPANYKRPTALISPRMVEDAMKTIKDLELEEALQRRFAKISDVRVNNVLWVNGVVKDLMKSPLEGLLMEAASTRAPKKTVEAETVSIDDFMSNILPTAASVEILFNNQHQGNLMSLTAPVHEDSKQLFKWNNDFAWSYNGNITDSIKEKVKNAGGNVTNAAMRVSLAWFNYDDLDIYVVEPSGNQICFHNKSNCLDVDMNAGGRRQSRTPVENVSFTAAKLRDGTYKVQVNNYIQVEKVDGGFTIEIENQGKLTQLSTPVNPPSHRTVHVCDITVKSGVVVDLKVADGFTGRGISQDVWGLKTETFVKVNTVMYSPNYWDDNAVGNKHVFFIVDKCKNDLPTRGIYNEFLSSKLEKHRKVFEVLGNKTMCQPTEDQLSGLGFSSTRGDTVTVKVTDDKRTRTLNIQF